MSRSVYLNLGRTDTCTGGVPSNFRHLIIQLYFQFTVDFGRAAAVDVNNLNISGSEAWVSSSNAPQAVAARAQRSLWKDVFPVIRSWGLLAGCDVRYKIAWIYNLGKVAKLPRVQNTYPVVELGLSVSGSGTWKLSVICCLPQNKATFQRIDCDPEFGGVFGERGAQCKTCQAGLVIRKNRSEAWLGSFFGNVGQGLGSHWRIEPV